MLAYPAFNPFSETLNSRLRMEPLHSHSNTGIYTPSHDELLDLVDYLRSQSVKGLPPQISAILDNLEKSMFRTTGMTDDQQSSISSHVI